MIQGIELKAILNKITSTTDGGWRITLDVSNDEAAQIMELSKHWSKLLQIAIIPFPRNFETKS